MHLETIQHLRSLASQHDDLVPIAKPLLLDLLDSYERHAGKEQRLLTGLVESERELAQIREAGTPACPINASMTHHAALHGLPHWQCVSHKSNAWWRRVDGYEETYFDATTSYPDVLRRIDELVPMADPDTLPDPQDLQRLRYQPHWSGREMDAIDELSRLKDLEPVAIVRQALRHYQLAGAEVNNPALPVPSVTPVNPVTSPQPPNPAPETFEAHGHTWTRHTPGDPCPVPPDTLVHVLLREELHDPVFCDPKGSKWSWAANIHDRTDEIIGWRYAEPQPSTPAK